MNVYILLFRAINVGGRNILPMKELVAILEALGYSDIKTYIQSGNVVLRHKRSVGKDEFEQIQYAIETQRGFKPQIFILEESELRRIVAQNPFANRDIKPQHIFLLETEAKPERTQVLIDLLDNGEEFELIGRVCYFYAPNGIGRSKWASQFEKKVQVLTTARNWNTWLKLLQMLG